MQKWREKLDYKWVILIVCFFMEFVCLGFCSSNVGLYLVPVTTALEIPRSLYSFNESIRYVVQTLTALSFGTITQHFGLKKPVCVGGIALALSVFLRAVATNIWGIFLGSVFWGFGIVLMGGTMASTIIRRWFDKDLGKYIGIVMSANGIGGAAAAQIISPIINNGETFGYRKAYLLSAAITLAFCVVVVLFLKEKPAESTAATTAGKKVRGELWNGLPYEVIKRKPYFYLTAVMVFLTGISLQSIGSISIAHMTDVGLSAGFVATTATISSLTLTVSKFLVGFTFDKRGLRFTLLMCHGLSMVAFALKALLNDSTLGMVFAIIAVSCTSFALPLETVMLPLLSNELFGAKAYNKVLGIFMAANSMGLCLGSPLGNFYFDKYGTYVPCFWFFCVLMLLVSVGFQLVISKAYKDKNALLTQAANT